MPSLQLRFHKLEQVKARWWEIQHCHLDICQDTTMQTSWLLTRIMPNWWKNSAHCISTPFSHISTSHIFQWCFLIKLSPVSNFHSHDCYNKSIIGTFWTNFVSIIWSVRTSRS
jgi:hypothetical protein